MPDSSVTPDPGADGSTAGPPPVADAEPLTGESAESESSESDEPVFANRAARRAHAKGTKPRPPVDTAGQFGRRGTVQSPRQYGTRRSG